MKTVMKKKILLLSLTLMCLLGVTVLVAAATNYIPTEQADGRETSSINPQVSGQGIGAEVLAPEVIPEEEEVVVKPPFNPFIPGITDDEPFIDIEDDRDYSKQYDYTNAVLTAKNGNCNVVDGVYTTTGNSSIYANISPETQFPYGTISADVMNNGSDSGLIFGLSSNKNTFWEGSGISYYFAFISYEGNLFLGRTNNGTWDTLSYVKIAGFDQTATYNLKVLYRVEKIILFVNDVPLLSYRTDEPLTGTGWGIRTGVAGAVISNVKISNKVTMD